VPMAWARGRIPRAWQLAKEIATRSSSLVTGASEQVRWTGERVRYSLGRKNLALPFASRPGPNSTLGHHRC